MQDVAADGRDGEADKEALGGPTITLSLTSSMVMLLSYLLCRLTHDHTA